MAMVMDVLYLLPPRTPDLNSTITACDRLHSQWQQHQRQYFSSSLAGTVLLLPGRYRLLYYAVVYTLYLQTIPP